jgi:3-methyladenine DNA glycosylase/8-oxoguanine DNA glycosylase
MRVPAERVAASRRSPARSAPRATTFDVRLIGAAGEPVDLARTIRSHGLSSLPPSSWGESGAEYRTTLPLEDGRARTAVIRQGAHGIATVEVVGPPPSARDLAALARRVTHVLRLDEDLSAFYALVAGDEGLAWARAGAGRMMRSASAFEDVVKTICTTNCTWSATVRMVSALVEHLGVRAPGAPPTGPAGRAFPTPAAMAGADDEFYTGVVRAGYRGAYLRRLAQDVADGTIDLEAWGRATRAELPDDELARRLLALPGVGPYAAAHVMMMLGRYSRLTLDSSTRPKYARLVGRRTASDTAIARRFRRYGPWAGLAFWLFVTRDWIPEDGARGNA